MTPYENATYRLSKMHHYSLVYILGATAYGISRYKDVSFWGSLAIGVATSVVVSNLDLVGFKQLKREVSK